MNTSRDSFPRLLCFAVLILSAGGASILDALNLPTDLDGVKNYRLPPSVVNPNVRTSIDFGFGASVDPNSGLINLAGGIADGFGVDGGILAISNGNSVTFLNKGGKATASGGGSAAGNRGASAFGSVDAIVPTVLHGIGLSQAQSITGGSGRFGLANGHAGVQVG